MRGRQSRVSRTLTKLRTFLRQHFVYQHFVYRGGIPLVVITEIQNHDRPL